MINSDFQEIIMSGNHNERLIKYKKRCEEK